MYTLTIIKTQPNKYGDEQITIEYIIQDTDLQKLEDHANQFMHMSYLNPINNDINCSYVYQITKDFIDLLPITPNTITFINKWKQHKTFIYNLYTKFKKYSTSCLNNANKGLLFNEFEIDYNYYWESLPENIETKEEYLLELLLLRTIFCIEYENRVKQNYVIADHSKSLYNQLTNSNI